MTRVRVIAASAAAAAATRWIQLPAHYLDGDRDFIVQGTDHARLDAELRQWALQLRGTMILPGCGHWTRQERPAEVTAALADFASSLDSPRHP
ncbi:alpha/beta fold hydrolase [Streptomyces sp. NPDC102270]|uniref:alpha/beta fold hydrolase n=1 Tax=Streptomyces sp. NPDC102270 TaxID=3366150 RepID=UPI00380420F0